MSRCDIFKKLKEKKFAFPFVLIVLNALLWYPALKFWFFLGWEQSYLIGICGGKFNFICMMQSHGILYLINYKLFGWNATGWYLTAIILFTTSVLLLYKLVDLIAKNKTIAFITAVLFSANVAHNDIVNWGSFTGHYALIFVSLLLGIFAYRQFSFALESKKKARTVFWYLLMLLAYSFGLFIREVALVFPFWILFFELLSKGFRFSGKYFIKLIKIFAPLGVFSLGFLLLRLEYGGSPHDLIDAMVQLRMALLAQGLYGEYIWRGILAFGKFAASHLIPYPLMNIVREFVAGIFSPQIVRYYFFSVAGIAYTVLLIFLIWVFRKVKTTRNLLLFSFLWFVIPTVFYSFAFSIDDYALVQPYGLDTTRWRYFAFFGTVLFWVTVFWKLYNDFSKTGRNARKKARQIVFLAIALVTSVNFYFLRIEQKERYLTVYKPAREFYTSFLRTFKTLPKDYVFYLTQGSSPLGDYIFEWYFIRQAYYPYLTEDRGREFGAGYFGMLLERFLDGTANIYSTYFLDYNYDKGVIVRTEEAKNVIFGQRSYTYSVNKSVNTSSVEDLEEKDGHQIDIDLNPGIHVETPYVYEITVNTTPFLGRTLEDYSASKIAALRNYTTDRLDFLKNVKVSVCATAPAGSQGKPATHLVKKHITDGNISSRSLWIADCRPAWVILDLGKTKRVGAIAFNSLSIGPHLGTDYLISLSNDGETWTDVISVEQNDKAQRIDKLPEVVGARYVKFTVMQTSEGGMATFAELQVLDETSLPVLEFYGDDFEKLIKESRNFGSAYMRFSWQTDPDNDPPGQELVNKSTFIPVATSGYRTYTIEPNEGEFYSGGGQFLKRLVTSIHLDFVGEPANIKVLSVKAVPKFFISKDD